MMMKDQVEISEELKQVSPLLAGLDKTNLFSIPEGYFNCLPHEILHQVTGKIPVSKNESMLTTPEGYFESLAPAILNKIRSLQKESAADEIKTLSPALYALKDKNIFNVPTGYFNSLADQVVQKTVSPGKVIRLTTKSPAWKIAAAAVITGFIAVSSLWFTKPAGEKNNGLAINDQAPTHFANEYTNKKQIEEGIARLSDDDIIKYLQITGSDIDNESLTASIEEKELPAQEDYLADEKTLMNYLEKIETNASN